MTATDLAITEIERALETGQVGTPVAARIVDAASSDATMLEGRLTKLLESATRWLETQPTQLTACGSPSQGQITALMLLDGGFSILASASLVGKGSPQTEIVVFGNRGIMSREPDCAATFTLEKGRDEPRSPFAETILRRVRQSWSQQAAVNFADGSLVEPTASGSEGPSDRAEYSLERDRPHRVLTPPYGVLLVSGDHTHQPGYAGAFAADPRCRLIGLVDEPEVPRRREDLNRRLAARLGIPFLTDLRQALARNDVHVVCICAEPFRRGRIVVQSAEAGKHLYLDKPLCSTLADADEIVASVRKAGVTAQMFSQVHWQTATRIRRVVESGAIGELVAIHSDLCFAKGVAGTADLSRPRSESARPLRYELVESKRELTNVGVYSVVLMLWLFDQRVRRLMATTGNYFFAEHQRDGLEDFGQILLEFGGGLVGSVTVGRTGWRSHPGSGLDRTYLVGTKRTLVVDRYRPRVEIWSDGEPWTAPRRDPTDPMGMWAPLPDSPYRARPKEDWITSLVPSWNTDVGQFLDCLERGESTAVPVEMAAAATEVLSAAYQSAATGKWVKLPLERTVP